MLGKKVMTSEKKRERGNYLRRSCLKKIKAENTEEYQNHLKQKKNERERRIKKLKTVDNGKGYKRFLELKRKYKPKDREKARERHKEYQREHRKKLKAENDGLGYREHLEKRRKMEGPQNKQRRDQLSDSYVRKLLVEQGLKNDEISEKQIIDKRNQLLLKRKLRPQKRKVQTKQKELTGERAKENEIYNKYLHDNKLKRCGRCKELKSLNDFSPCRLKNPSYASICKSCEVVLNRQKNRRKKALSNE